MDYLWDAAGVLITGTVFYFLAKRRLEFKRRLPGIAATLGLQYFDRGDQLPILRMMAKWGMEGEFDGVKVKIGPHSHARTAYVRAEAFFGRPRSLGLSISNGSRAAVGNPEIRIEGLDRPIVITAEQEAQARQLLGEVDVRQAIADAFAFDSSVFVDDEATRLDRAKFPLDPEEYRNVLAVLTRVVRVLDAAS